MRTRIGPSDPNLRKGPGRTPPLWSGLAYGARVLAGSMIGLIALAFVLSRSALKPDLLRATAHATAGMLSILGLAAYSEGMTVVLGGFRGHMILECTAAFPIAILTGAIVCSPVPWRRRFSGVVTSSLILLAGNQIRLTILILCGAYLSDTFEVLHLLVAQALMSLLTIWTGLRWIVKNVD